MDVDVKEAGDVDVKEAEDVEAAGSTYGHENQPRGLCGDAPLSGDSHLIPPWLTCYLIPPWLILHRRSRAI